jgi:hypothetical protein
MKKIKIIDEKIVDKLIFAFRSANAAGPIDSSYNCPVTMNWREISSKPLLFFKNWSQPRLPDESGASFLFHNGDNLNIISVMEDSDVFNEAAGRNDQTWTKGDVLEFFIQPANKKNYFEIHVAPTLATLELSIPDADKLKANECPWGSLFFDSGSEFGAEVISKPDFKGWWGLISLPFESVGMKGEKGESANFAVCRYNYTRGNMKTPECSSSAPFKKLAFHCPDQWQKIILE